MVKKSAWSVWQVASPPIIESLPPTRSVEADEAKDTGHKAGKVKKTNKNAGKIRKSKPR